MPRTLQHIEDELLVLRCQDGEPEALGQLMARWQARLRAHAWSLTGRADAVAEVSQEAWMSIAKDLHRLLDPAHFGPWAYRIVTHKCADWIRARKRRDGLVRRFADAGTEPTAPPVSEGGEIDRLRASLATLAPDQRAILFMHHLDAMSVNQIAMALDIPAGTVKSRLHHARAALKASFERRHP